MKVLLIILFASALNINSQEIDNYNNDNKKTLQSSLKNLIATISNQDVNKSKSSYDNNILNASEDIYTLIIQADKEMELLWVFTEDANDTFTVEDKYQHKIPVGKDAYELITLFEVSNYHYKFIYKKDINVYSDTTLVIESTDANIMTTFEFLREDYSPLIINSFIIAFDHPNDYMGLSTNFTRVDTIGFIFQYNELPDKFRNSWVVKGKQTYNFGNLYLINNHLYDTIIDTFITNSPDNYVHADIYYHFSDSLELTFPEAQVGTNVPFSHWYQSDPDYFLPLHMRIYQDISSDFSLRESRFSQKVIILSTDGPDLKTAEIRLNKDGVRGYLMPDLYHEPFIISESNEVHLGRTPTYWYGRFQNDEDTVKIRSPFGLINAHQLFLSQTNDVLKQIPIIVQIYKNDEMIFENESLTAGFGIWIQYGFDENDITFPLDSDKYEMVLINNRSEVAKHPASTHVKTSFDLRLPDRNPPYLQGFQILSDSEISNVLNSDSQNIIRFIAKDDQELSSVQLFYAHYRDTLWNELPIEIYEQYFQTEIPEIGNGYYSIKIFLSDSSQNSIETIMSPAFHIGNVTSIGKNDAGSLSGKIKLYPAYPNPFNSEVRFQFFIPKENFKEIDISIYNIIGQKIITLFNEKSEPGTHELMWNGRDMNNKQVSSGLYFIQLKGGDAKDYQKILLVK
jgi:hypothetical protein